MTAGGGVPAPWWVLVLVVLAGTGVGSLLARRLATTGYRLDDEQGPPPAPPWVVVVAVPAVWAALTWKVGGVARGAVLPAFLLVGAVGVALAWVDLDVHRLPEGLTLPTVPALVALLAVAAASTGDWGALLRAGLAAAAVWLVYVVLALVNPGGLGLGDATLGGLVSLPLGFLGWGVAGLGVVLGFVLGALVTLVLLALRRVRLKGAVAFGPFILLGTLAAVLVGYQHPGA